MKQNYKEYIFKCKRDYLIAALEASNWNVAKAAKISNIDRTSLYGMIKRYRIESNGKLCGPHKGNADWQMLGEF